MTKGAIYIVATPIGNTEDLSPRARRVLEEVDLIAAEDTRKAGLLLQRLGLPKKPLISYYDAIEEKRAAEIVARIQSEQIAIAVISDAGTPCIADPGYRLVSLARSVGIPVHPIPGPSALTTLVCASGLPSQRLLFVGFLPAKPSALKQEIATWPGFRGSIVFFEATRRLKNVLQLIQEMIPGSMIAIGRELTKLHEEIVLLTLEEALVWVESHLSLKGEATVMIAIPVAHDEGILTLEDLRQRLRQDLAKGSTFKDLLQKYKDSGYARSTLYQEMLAAKEEEGEP